MSILLIAPKSERTEALAQSLREEGYEVDLAFEGWAGKRLLEKAAYQVTIIENRLPDVEGSQLCKMISEDYKESSLLLIASPNQCNVLEGFAAGIDEYIPQPADCREIIARVKALTRRGKFLVPINRLKAGDILLDLDSKEVNKGGRQVDVTASEFRLLEFMIRNKNKVLSKKEIAFGVWGYDIEEKIRKLTVHMKKLRGKLTAGSTDDCHIYTVSRRGYIMMEKA